VCVRVAKEGGREKEKKKIRKLNRRVGCVDKSPSPIQKYRSIPCFLSPVRTITSSFLRRRVKIYASDKINDLARPVVRKVGKHRSRACA
jgi:hypothetical protein